MSLILAFGFGVTTSCSKVDVKPSSAQTENAATAADTTRPTVKFTSPKNQDTLSDSITIKIKATDNVAVTSVECKIDGVSLGIKTTSPYNFGWNTKTVMNGTHQLLAQAIDASGNSTTKKITVHTLNASVLAMEQDLISLINAERASRSLIPLNSNSKLMTASRNHSKDMADNKFFSHTGSDGSSLGVRLDRVGYPWTAAAENIAGGQTTAQAVFDAWMLNTGQKTNLLDPNRKDIGVGCAYSSAGNSPFHSYWTAVFATTQ